MTLPPTDDLNVEIDDRYGEPKTLQLMPPGEILRQLNLDPKIWHRRITAAIHKQEEGTGHTYFPYARRWGFNWFVSIQSVYRFVLIKSLDGGKKGPRVNLRFSSPQQKARALAVAQALGLPTVSHLVRAIAEGMMWVDWIQVDDNHLIGDLDDRHSLPD